jgi:hypothetical protein
VITIVQQEFTENLSAGRRFSMSLDLEVDAGTSTSTSPRRDLSQLELIQILPGFFRAMLQHPARKIALGICERTIVLCAQMTSSKCAGIVARTERSEIRGMQADRYSYPGLRFAPPELRDLRIDALRSGKTSENGWTLAISAFFSLGFSLTSRRSFRV